MKLNTTDLIREIFHDNRKICLEIEESQVRRFAQLMCENGLYPRSLELLQVLSPPSLLLSQIGQSTRLEKNGSLFVSPHATHSPS